MGEEKTCGKCGETKPLEEFHKHKACKGGRQGTCKACHSAAGKGWRTENRERALVNEQAYRDRRHAELAEYHARWRAANPDKIKVAHTKAYAKHRDRWGDWVQDRRARLEAAFVLPVRRDEILQRDGGRCGVCGDPVGVDFHIDHVIPLAAGGTHEPDNVQIAHPLCNLQKWKNAA